MDVKCRECKRKVSNDLRSKFEHIVKYHPLVGSGNGTYVSDFINVNLRGGPSAKKSKAVSTQEKS
jgi:hypothetical protein